MPRKGAQTTNGSGLALTGTAALVTGDRLDDHEDVEVLQQASDLPAVVAAR